MKRVSILMIFILIGLTFIHAQKSSRTEVYKGKDGKEIKLHLYGHASLAIEVDGTMFYIDPVSGMADYSKEKRADKIFVTHSHGDHFDMKTIKSISRPTTHIYCDKATSEKISDMKMTAMKPGDIADLGKGVKVEAIAAYNITEGHTKFHPKSANNCGYLFNIGKTRIYVAGDSENIEEMKSLKNIDIAFLPVNQPYTMTVEQVTDVVKAMRPAIFFPYHYGNVEEKTDMKLLEKEVKPYTSIKINNME